MLDPSTSRANTTSMQQAQVKAREADSLLPDFCSADAVVTVMVFTQMMALLLTLAGRLGDTLMWQRLFLLSLYLQWIGLSSAAALCQVRRWFAGMPALSVLILSYALLIAVSFVISEL